jgi:SAM-dependent methyltransferase
VSDIPSSEFTGERVIPAQVNDDLWAEHISRYAFAARLANAQRVLDVGCGTGYGTQELARCARIAIGLDVAQEAITYARGHFTEPRFLLASATALPFPDGCFDLIAAFEVIEHLSDWRLLLTEARRVLAMNGLFLVSTPNKLYYAESRAEYGPNPFHTHEFEYDEFHNALSSVFPHVAILLQNRLETIAFYPSDRETRADVVTGRATDSPNEANFFLAICSTGPLPSVDSLFYVPALSNLLRERERHIRLLESELQQNKTWLTELTTDRDQLLHKHADLEQHLEQQNLWAQGLERNWKAAQERIVQLQDEVQRTTAGYENKIRELDQENRQKTQWALDTEQRLTAELQACQAEFAKTVNLLDQAETTVVERTQWAQRAESRVRELEQLLAMVRQSRWLKAGNAIGVGPRIPGAEGT